MTIAGILILIDYKLKRDLVDLFARIEAAIETGNRLYDTDTAHTYSGADIRDSTVVGNNPTVETADVPKQSNPDGENGHKANGYVPTQRSRGTRNKTVPGTDKPV